MKNIHLVTVEWWRQDGKQSDPPAAHIEGLNAAAFEQISERLADGYREGELFGGAGVYRGHWSVEEIVSVAGPVSLAAHAKILSAYLHRLTVADVEAMLEAVKDSHHAGANLGTNSQAACHTALELVVAERLSSKLAHDLDNVASIIRRELEQTP